MIVFAVRIEDADVRAKYLNLFAHKKVKGRHRIKNGSGRRFTVLIETVEVCPRTRTSVDPQSRFDLASDVPKWPLPFVAEVKLPVEVELCLDVIAVVKPPSGLLTYNQKFRSLAGICHRVHQKRPLESFVWEGSDELCELIEVCLVKLSECFHSFVHWWKVAFGQPLVVGVLLALMGVPHFLRWYDRLTAGMA